MKAVTQMKDLSYPNFSQDDLDNKVAAINRKLFYRIFDPIALYRVLYDEKGNPTNVIFMDINPAYERVMGVRRKDIIGKSFGEVWPLAEREWHQLVLEVAQSGRSKHHEGESRDTGKYLHALGFSPVKGQVAVIFLDMTEWKRSEEALHKSESLLIDYREKLRDLVAKLSLAEEETRRAIATKLHDKVGYSLAMIMHRLQHLYGEADKESCRQEIKEIMDMLSGVIQDTRSMTFEISSPLLYEVGLPAALESLAEQILKPHDIAVDFKVIGMPGYEFDRDVSVLLYQMTRELLINVVKHAEATCVSIRVHYGKNKIRIVVEDDGKGFDERKKRPNNHGGFGLFSIKERLYSIGGSIQIISEPGKGTTVSLVAPAGKDGQDAG